MESHGLSPAEHRVKFQQMQAKGYRVAAISTVSVYAELVTASVWHLAIQVPDDIAFQAMAHQQLDHKEEAAKLLSRLRVIMKQDRWAKDTESQGFLREAEVLIEGKPTPPASSKKKSD